MLLQFKVYSLSKGSWSLWVQEQVHVPKIITQTRPSMHPKGRRLSGSSLKPKPSTLNPKPLNPKPLNPTSPNPKPLNPKPLNPQTPKPHTLNP